MRTLILLLSIAILVTACGPAATPEPPTAIPSTSIPPPAIPPTEPPAPTAPAAPVELPVAAMDEVAGLWWFTGCPCKVQLNPDGSYALLGRANEPPEAVGNFTLDAGKVTWVTSDPLCKDLPAATYEAYVTKQEGKLVSLRLQLVGTDACAMRVDALKGPAKFLNR